MNTASNRAGNNTLFIPNNDIGDHADFPGGPMTPQERDGD